VQGSSPFNCGIGQAITRADQCPSNPPPIDAALLSARLGAPGALGALGLLALVVLTLFIYTPMECLPGSPPASTPVSFAALHILFAAAVLLWFATGLFLAAPSVPWILVPTPSSIPSDPSVFTANAFTVSVCRYEDFANVPDLNNNILFCSGIPLLDALAGQTQFPFPSLPSAGATPAAAIATAAFSITVCGACTQRVSAPPCDNKCERCQPSLTYPYHPTPSHPLQCTSLPLPRCYPQPSSPASLPTASSCTCGTALPPPVRAAAAAATQRPWL
jgi:hypothetical protein